MGLIAFQLAKWTDLDNGEFKGLHKWCQIVLNLTSIIGWTNQATIVPSLQGLLWSSYCSYKRLSTSPALPIVQFLELFLTLFLSSLSSNMFVSLDQIEFYHGPPCPQFQSSLSSTKRKQSSTLSVTEPVHHSFPAGPVPAPGSNVLAFPENRSENLFQLQDRLSTSISKPCNIFNVELANIGHETGRPQLQNTGPVERNGGSCLNGEISHDQVPQVDEYGSSSSGKLSHVCAYCINWQWLFPEPYCNPEPRHLGTAIDKSAVIETSLDLARSPSCLSAQANPEDSAASVFPQVDHKLEQVLFPAQNHGEMGKSWCMVQAQLFYWLYYQMLLILMRAVSCVPLLCPVAL